MTKNVTLLQNEEARIAREVEANENRIRKALEKENILRRKVFIYHLGICELCGENFGMY